MIQKYFSYTGRLNRLRYFLRILVVMILASILGTLLVQVSEYLAYIVSFIALSVPLCWASVAAMISTGAVGFIC